MLCLQYNRFTIVRLPKILNTKCYVDIHEFYFNKFEDQMYRYK